MAVCSTVMAEEKEHTVARGETFASIAKMYGLSEDQLKAANPNTSLCFAGMKLVIPDPSADASAKESKAKAGKEAKEKKDDGDKGGGLNKLVKSVGDALGDAAKVTGVVLTTAAMTKLHGGSTYDIINNSIQATSNKSDGKEKEYTIRGRKVNNLVSGSSKRNDTDSSDDATDSDDDKKGKKTVSDNKKEKKKVEEETDPELEELYQSYVTNYNQMASEMEKLKDVYTKANNTAKIRTWTNVSESANAYRQQMEKLREDCEKFTGKLIETSSVESWRPVSPRK